MTEVLKGKTVAEAEALFRAFHAKVTGGEEPAVAEDLAEDYARLEPLGGVKAYPVRVKCATLPWRTLEAALKSDHSPVKTE
jgi:nitrogen fixation NifU-like protein